MSFQRVFRRFLQVSLDDNDGNAVDAFAIAPLPRTIRAMAMYALAWRVRPDGLSLFAQFDPAAAQALIAPINRLVRFSFALRARKRDFFARYHPDSSDTGKTLLLANLDNAGTVRTSGALTAGTTVEQADLVTVGRPGAFPVTLDLSGGTPDRLRVLDRFDGTQIAEHEFAVPASAGNILKRNFDLGRLPRPDVRLRTPVPGTFDLIAYADDEAASRRPAILLDLWWDQTQDAVPPVTGVNFTATFRRR